MPASLLTVTPLTASGISHVGFLPSQLTGLILWLDANQITGITSGTSLSAWTDSSGSANHARQSSAVSQGVFYTNTINGGTLSTISFLGTGASGMTTNANLVTPYSIFYVVKSLTTGASRRDINSETINGAISYGRSGNNNFFPGATVCSLTTWDLSTPHSLGLVVSVATAPKAWIDGINRTTASAATNSWGTLSIGGSEAPGSQICEITAYTHDLSGVEQNYLVQYFQQKWGTP